MSPYGDRGHSSNPPTHLMRPVELAPKFLRNTATRVRSGFEPPAHAKLCWKHTVNDGLCAKVAELDSPFSGAPLALHTTLNASVSSFEEDFKDVDGAGGPSPAGPTITVSFTKKKKNTQRNGRSHGISPAILARCSACA